MHNVRAGSRTHDSIDANVSDRHDGAHVDFASNAICPRSAYPLEQCHRGPPDHRDQWLWQFSATQGRRGCRWPAPRATRDSGRHGLGLWPAAQDAIEAERHLEHGRIIAVLGDVGRSLRLRGEG